MPCDCRYMDDGGPSALELSLSRIACLLDEVKHGIPVNREWWENGDHPRLREMHLRFDFLGMEKALDEWGSELCALVRERGAGGYSLELQIWWRDHQIEDAKREAREEEERQRAMEREAALAKLTDREKALLGLRE